MKVGAWVGFLAFSCLIAAGTSSAFAADPDLVLHYRFDQDQGDKVVDHSRHKNDGAKQIRPVPGRGPRSSRRDAL